MEKERDGDGHQSGGKRYSMLSDQDQAALLKAGTLVGDETLEYEIWHTYTVRMVPSLEKYLRALGGGDFSDGVVIAAKFYRERCEQDKRGGGPELCARASSRGRVRTCG
jgi:hypothetical protein